MEDIVFQLVREHYSAQTTAGIWYDHCGDEFCKTLEDTVRPLGIKVYKHTAIPGGIPQAPIRYEMDVTMSTRFGREMVTIFKNKEGVNWKVVIGNVVFKGIRAHGGNDHLDTEGCPLVAKHRDGWDKVYESMEEDLTALVKKYKKEGRRVFLDVINEPQNG